MNDILIVSALAILVLAIMIPLTYFMIDSRKKLMEYKKRKAVGKEMIRQIVQEREKTVDKSVIEKELEIAKAKMLAEGKPEHMVEKIATGKLQYFNRDIMNLAATRLEFARRYKLTSEEILNIAQEPESVYMTKVLEYSFGSTKTDFRVHVLMIAIETLEKMLNEKGTTNEMKEIILEQLGKFTERLAVVKKSIP